MEPRVRIRVLERAISELLESETNGSLVLSSMGRDCEPLIVTALGCSVLMAVGPRPPILVAIPALNGHGRSGPRALAEGCDRTLRTVYDLRPDFVPTLFFADAANARRFREWML